MAALDDPAAGFAPGIKTKMIAAADYLAVAPQVVAVARDVTLPAIDGPLPAHGPGDPDAVATFAERYNLGGATKRLIDAMASVA